MNIIKFSMVYITISCPCKIKAYNFLNIYIIYKYLKNKKEYKIKIDNIKWIPETFPKSLNIRKSVSPGTMPLSKISWAKDDA